MNKVPTLLDVHSEAILLDQPHLPRVGSVNMSWDFASELMLEVV